LRAGQVAIVEGKFLYFCDAGHKADYFAGKKSSFAREEVETREPPRVAPSKEEPQPAEEPSAASVPAPETIVTPEPEPVPLSLPEPRPAPRETPDETPPRDQPNALPLFGVAVGVLAAAVRLVGPAVDAAQLPFAVFAFGVFVFVSITTARRTGDLLLRAPSLAGSALAIGVASWARFAGDARASSLITFAGVSIAALLAADVTAIRARAAIQAVRDRLAKRLAIPAKVVRGDAVVTTTADDVRAGEQVIVEEGDLVPVDGMVSAGEAVVLPWAEAPADMPKREGDAIVAGAQVVRGSLRVTTTRAGADRAWLRLTLSKKSGVDVASPLVVAARRGAMIGAPLSAVLAGVAGIATGQSAPETLAAAAAAAMAVGAAGPAIAASVRHARGQLAALKHGILYRDASAFDRAGQVDVAVACARGTLLLGEPEVVAVEPLGGQDPVRVLELAAGVSSGSTHPFAQAILRTARARGIRPENVRNAVHAGSGATAIVATGERLVLGRRAFLLSEKVSVAVADARTTELEAQGRSVLLAALEGKVIGLLALQDGLRAGARAAIQRLHDARIEPVFLSGEARETCEAIGRALDIDHVRPEVASQDRAAEIRALGGGGRVVAVIGHPARDDGALGAADVSVAMGAAGAGVGEWSVVLASEDVRDAALALTIPQRARERARVAVAMGTVPAVLAALLVILVGLPYLTAPLAAFVGSSAALLYAKE
jgi:P-type E1-E2 ATPase